MYLTQSTDGAPVSGSGVKALVEYPLQGLYHPNLGSRAAEFIEMM